MASTARTDELKKKFDENPRRYFAPLANEFRKAGDIDQAILICEEFLPQQPGHMSGHIVYGQALYEAGKMPESRTVFETALGLDPENLIALRHLGDIARGQSDHAAARIWYVRVLDADPRNEEIQALIATLDGESPLAEPDATVEAPPPLNAPAFEMGLDFEKEFAPFEKAFAHLEPAILPAAEKVASIDPSLADTAPLGVRVIPPAEGLELTAFMPPEEHIREAADLDESLDSGVPSFSVPAEPIASLAGLQGSGAVPHADLDDSEQRSEHEGFAPLDLDDGLVLPPQGDPRAADALQPPADAAKPETTSHAELLDFDGALPEPSAHEEIEGADVHGEESEPSELAAAEGTLVEHPAATAAPFVTETMAALYVAQGFPAQALSVYTQLLSANPEDARLAGLVESLTPAAAVEDIGPNVRDFFARLAAHRPGTRNAAAAPPADDDFAPAKPVAVMENLDEEAPYGVAEAEAAEEAEAAAEPEAEAEAETEAHAGEFAESQAEATPEAVAPAIERAAAMRTPGGSIDALFSQRPPGTSEDSAAAALAQAFGGDAVVPPAIAGRPARAASGELSLDSVFRDGPARPPRTSQSFSFDQFFTGAAEHSGGSTPERTPSELAMPGDAPAERSADDIEQFNSWLQGLKQR